MVIPEHSISQKHARLVVSAETLKICDLNSKNGTKIDREDNLLQPQVEFQIDQTMTIYLADIKCTFILNLPPKALAAV